MKAYVSGNFFCLLIAFANSLYPDHDPHFGGHFVYKSWTICTILVEGIMMTFVRTYFESGPVVLEQDIF